MSLPCSQAQQASVNPHEQEVFVALGVRTLLTVHAVLGFGWCFRGCWLTLALSSLPR